MAYGRREPADDLLERPRRDNAESSAGPLSLAFLSLRLLWCFRVLRLRSDQLYATVCKFGIQSVRLLGGHSKPASRVNAWVAVIVEATRQEAQDRHAPYRVAEHIQTCVNIHGPRPGAVCARTMDMLESEQMTAFGGADFVKVLLDREKAEHQGQRKSRTPTGPSRTKSTSIKPLRRILDPTPSRPCH